LLRVGAVSALLAGAVFLVPPLRSGMAHARTVLVDAMAASRRAELRRLATARYALEYGVSLELASAVERAAVAEGVDPELAFRLVRVESEFKETAVSPVGALGLTQLMPATAESLQPGITREQIFDRHTNLRLGFRYLRWLLDVYDGDVTEALHAYNRGPGTVARLRARGEDPANGYADRILRGQGTPSYSGNGLLR
jgi:soluble lytic murein transglycosylase-like protein